MTPIEAAGIAYGLLKTPILTRHQFLTMRDMVSVAMPDVVIFSSDYSNAGLILNMLERRFPELKP